MSAERFLRPGAKLGLRDPAFRDAMRRAEEKANPPKPGESPDDLIGQLPTGQVVTRGGRIFYAGEYLYRSGLPLIWP